MKKLFRFLFGSNIQVNVFPKQADTLTYGEVEAIAYGLSLDDLGRLIKALKENQGNKNFIPQLHQDIKDTQQENRKLEASFSEKDKQSNLPKGKIGEWPGPVPPAIPKLELTKKELEEMIRDRKDKLEAILKADDSKNK